jgi:drug/metabolite transporter (DMT)-like permease
VPVPLHLLAAACGPLGLAAVFNGISLGYEGGHKLMTVAFWVVLGIGLISVAAIYGLWFWNQKRSNGTDANVNYGQQDVGINKGTFNKGD